MFSSLAKPGFARVAFPLAFKFRIFRLKRFENLFFKKFPRKLGYSVIGLYVVARHLIKPLRCNGLPGTYQNANKVVVSENSSKRSWFGKIWFCFLVAFRCVTLFLIYFPLLLFYPLLCWTEKTLRAWWNVVFFCIQHSGPVFIKFGQWASTRRDLFSAEFCNLFGRLHTKTFAHAWSYSKELLTLTFGNEWHLFLGDIPEQPCGSGCIAQVYKTTLHVSNLSVCKCRHLFDVVDDKPDKSGTKLDVAIKILHPNIERNVEIDITLLRGFARTINFLFSRVHCLDLLSCVGEFEKVIKKQTDLTYESSALKRFRQNFQSDSSVVFPKPLFESPCILIETFEEGVQISDYLSSEDVNLKNKLAHLGANGLLKMVFTDNYVHGDLHPGNILVQEFENKPPSWCLLAKWFPNTFPLTKNRQQQHRLVFLDTGLTVELKEKDLDNLRSVFRAVIEKNGKTVADLLLSQSPQQRCKNVDAFRDEISTLVNTALEQTVSLGQIHVSSLLTELLNVVSRHNVNLEPNFTCIVLAVLVLEGLGRSLDPNLDLIKCARKFLFA